MSDKVYIDVYAQVGDARKAITGARRISGKLDCVVRLVYGVHLLDIESTTDIESMIAVVERATGQGRTP